jgi:hypothetical protein
MLFNIILNTVIGTLQKNTIICAQKLQFLNHGFAIEISYGMGQYSGYRYVLFYETVTHTYLLSVY